MPRTIIIRKMQALCTSDVTQDVSIDTWPADVHIHWEQISGINRGGATTTIEVGLKRGSEFYSFRAGNAGDADRSVRLLGDLNAPGDFRPTARFLVAAVGDMLELTCAGYISEEG